MGYIGIMFWEGYGRHLEEWVDNRENNELMFKCAVCGKWHNTEAGIRMDALYKDVLPPKVSE